MKDHKNTPNTPKTVNKVTRKIIKIDEDKCNGCGLCADACHEGAIGIIDDKAKLLRDDYCDGLGDCLPICPTGAISIEERVALEYDEEAVNARNPEATNNNGEGKLPCGCPGNNVKTINRDNDIHHYNENAKTAHNTESCLNQWPIQIKLVPVNAPYFKGAKLLVAADCTAFSYGNFHNEFMKDKITLIGCPKLDEGDYSEKLTMILKENDIKSITVVRMEVPCCSGISNAVINALKNSRKIIPWQIITVTTDGKIVEE